jgi:hypothetical protein
MFVYRVQALFLDTPSPNRGPERDPCAVTCKEKNGTSQGLEEGLFER